MRANLIPWLLIAVWIAFGFLVMACAPARPCLEYGVRDVMRTEFLRGGGQVQYQDREIYCVMEVSD